MESWRRGVAGQRGQSTAWQEHSGHGWSRSTWQASLVRPLDRLAGAPLAAVAYAAVAVVVVWALAEWLYRRRIFVKR
jgi:predicted acyltransferase